MGCLHKLEEIVAALPEAQRRDLPEDEAGASVPAFRIGRRRFLFTDPAGCQMSVRAPYGDRSSTTGPRGWVTVRLPDDPDDARWDEIAERVLVSYLEVAPRHLAGRPGRS